MFQDIFDMTYRPSDITDNILTDNPADEIQSTTNLTDNQTNRLSHGQNIRQFIKRQTDIDIRQTLKGIILFFLLRINN